MINLSRTAPPFRIVGAEWGEPKTGKSDLILRSFPTPIWYVDLDFGYEEIEYKFRDREIIWKPIGESIHDLTNANLLTDPRYHETYLKEVIGTYVEGLEALRGTGGTVCIDTFTQVRQAIDSVKIEEVRERRSKILEKKGKDPETDLQVLPYDYCLAPGTKILKSNLTWVPIESLREGDSLIGFDEIGGIDGPATHRKFRESTVISVKRTEMPCYRVTTEKGSVICSELHQWLCVQPGITDQVWLQTRDLRDGCRIKHLVDPWEVDESNDSGYLSGFLDGEGSVTRFGGLSYAQKEGSVLSKVETILQDKGFMTGGNIKGGSGVYQGWINGGIGQRLRLLGSFRPIRLLEKSRCIWDGCGIRSTSYPVLSVEFLGVCEVVALQTSTKTFFAEGYFSHNSEANKITGAIVRRAYQTPGVNVMFIHRSATIYDANGRETNGTKLQGWKEITSAVGLVLHNKKTMETRGGVKAARFSVELDVVRGDPDLTGMEMIDPSYDELRALLER